MPPPERDPPNPDPTGDRWRVLIAGASGLVGSALARRLAAAGNAVTTLIRREPLPDEAAIGWDPAAGRLDPAAMEGFDAIVNLCGENIAAKRWTAARREAIRASRVGPTQLLARTAARLGRPPRVLVCASAVGYYGDRGDEELTEESPAGSGFLPQVCAAWEEAARPAAEAGIRVVNLRIGLVLARQGGALAKMLPVFRLGVGGVLGSGQQWMSWISLTDLTRVIEFAMRRVELTGAVNAVAPHPVTNREFTRVLGRVLGRPAVLPVPALAVRVGLGEMGRRLLLEGQRVLPAKLLAAGFSFDLPELEAALRYEIQQGG